VVFYRYRVKTGKGPPPGGPFPVARHTLQEPVQACSWLKGREPWGNTHKVLPSNLRRFNSLRQHPPPRGGDSRGPEGRNQAPGGRGTGATRGWHSSEAARAVGTGEKNRPGSGWVSLPGQEMQLGKTSKSGNCPRISGKPEVLQDRLVDGTMALLEAATPFLAMALLGNYGSSAALTEGSAGTAKRAPLSKRLDHHHEGRK